MPLSPRHQEQVDHDDNRRLLKSIYHVDGRCPLKLPPSLLEHYVSKIKNHYNYISTVADMVKRPGV